MSHFLHSIWAILNEMSPYVLLGFLFAGVLHEFVKPDTMKRHLAGRGWKPVVKAALFGIPLPLCSCGVLPTAVGLHRQGASKGATTSFLIATPQTGVDSIAATYSLLGLPLALIRPLAALVGGLVGGMGVNLLAGEKSGCVREDDASTVCGIKEAVLETAKPFGRKVIDAMRYGFVDMVASVGKWLVIGLVIAALITVFVPDKFLVSLSNRPILAMFAMIVISIPMYVCATGSIPIAMSLMVKGLNPGAAFVLLMAGPAANFASLMVLGKAIGRRPTAVYVGSVAIVALFFGMVIDFLLPGQWFAVNSGMIFGAGCHHETGMFSNLCTIFLLVLLAYTTIIFKHKSHNHVHNDMEKTIKINGMACNHCRMTVEKAIAAVPGVEKVEVDLASKTAVITGDYAPAAVTAAITEAGFEVAKP